MATGVRALGAPRADAIHANYWLSGIAGHAFEAPARRPARLDVPHPGPCEGRGEPGGVRPSRTRRRTRDRGRDHRLLGGTIPASCSELRLDQLVELYGADPSRVAESSQPGVDHAFFSPGDKPPGPPGARAGRITSRSCCSSVASSRSRGPTSPSGTLATAQPPRCRPVDASPSWAVRRSGGGRRGSRRCARSSSNLGLR